MLKTNFSQNTQPALKIQNLKKIYKNGVKALNGINLEIPQGQFYALLGANGAGKTTTIGIITDLVNKTSGKVEVFGIDIDKNFAEAKSYIGVVPQEFNFNQFEKVIDIVVQQAGYYGIRKSVAEQKAHKILDDLGLKDKKDKVSRSLSGGMKRRLMIARALIHNPKLLILDEPTAGVDIELRHGMWQYLLSLKEREGITLLLTTHYLEEVEQLCDRAAIIVDGQIIKEGRVKNLLKSMDFETYILETDLESEKIKDRLKQISDLEFKTNPEDIEITIQKKEPLNNLFEKLSKAGIKVISLRPKGNRLEELFLRVVKKSASKNKA